MRINSSTIVSGQSMGASYTSPAKSIDSYDQFAIQAVWTGTPTGTIKIQGSCNGVDFVDITGASTTLSGAGGSHIFDMESAVELVRVVFTRTGGDGSLSLYIDGRGE